MLVHVNVGGSIYMYVVLLHAMHDCVVSATVL